MFRKKKNIIPFWEFKQFILVFNNLIKRLLEAFYEMKTKGFGVGFGFSSLIV